MPKQEREFILSPLHRSQEGFITTEYREWNGGEERTVSQPVPQIYFGSTNSNLSEGIFEE